MLAYRMKTFDLLLNDSSSEERNRKLGGLMYESHQSYTDCGLGCDATDFIVDLVRKEKGLYGARITGGGSGGTVAVLGDAGAADAIARVVDVYGEETGRKPYVFR